MKLRLQGQLYTRWERAKDFPILGRIPVVLLDLTKLRMAPDCQPRFVISTYPRYERHILVRYLHSISLGTQCTLSCPPVASVSYVYCFSQSARWP